MSLKTPLKWVGGKTQILDKVLSHFPSTPPAAYYEPFLGGGSVLLGFLQQNPSYHGPIHAGDINPHVINFFQTLQASPQPLCDAIETLKTAYTAAQSKEAKEAFYYDCRTTFNSDTLDPISRAAHFLFLNKTCFRGLYRAGPRGFNVPYGHYVSPAIYDAEHLHAISALIQPVHFHHTPYSELLKNVPPGSFIYMDPPYVPVAKDSFVSYNEGGFGLEDHKALFTLTHHLAESDCAILMSNADTPMVREAFPTPAFTLETIQCRRAINSKKPGSTAMEVLLWNSKE
jgi:DNA adenine methylase